MRGKVALREALAARQARPARFAWTRAARLPLALSLALVLVMAISAAAVASSRPGDMLYPLRVAAERAPALIMITPASRAGTELDIADRRLKDLGDHLASAGEANAVALDALLLGDEMAAERALGLAAGERARLAARVAGHAEELRALAAVAVDPEADEMLRTAADRAQDIVNALRDPESGATQEGGRESVPSPQASPAAADFTPTSTSAPVHQPQPTSTPTALPATRQPPNVRPPGSETPGSPPPGQEPAQTRTPRPTLYAMAHAHATGGLDAAPDPHAAADPDALAHAYAPGGLDAAPDPHAAADPDTLAHAYATAGLDAAPDPHAAADPDTLAHAYATAGLDAAPDPHAAAGPYTLAHAYATAGWDACSGSHATAGLDATAHPPSAARLDAAGPDCCADGRWGDADRRTHGGHPAGGDIHASRHADP